MLQRIRGEYACYAGIEAAAEKRGDSRFLIAIIVGPLPLVLELRRILRLIVRGIHIGSLRRQTGIHDRKILIGKRQIQYYIRLYLLNQSDQLIHMIRIDLLRRNLRRGRLLQFLLQRVALRFRAAGNTDLRKYIAVLTAFMNGYTGNTAAADDQTLSHSYTSLIFRA